MNLMRQLQCQVHLQFIKESGEEIHGLNMYIVLVIRADVLINLGMLTKAAFSSQKIPVTG